MGLYVGQVINSTLFQNIRSTQLSFLNNMYGQGLLGSVDGSLPFSVICDMTNNPLSRHWSGICAIRRPGPISGYQRALHRQCGGRPDRSGLAANLTDWAG